MHNLYIINYIYRSGGVEIRGLHATRIQRRKNLGVPVLESYLFIPNNTNLSSQESIRVNTQILLENTLLYKIKCAEIVDAETPDDTLILSDLVVECLEDQPLIQHDVIILTELNLQTNLAVENKSIRDETDCSLIIGSRLFKRPQVIKRYFLNSLKIPYILMYCIKLVLHYFHTA